MPIIDAALDFRIYIYIISTNQLERDNSIRYGQ